jgi:hypothetical protein
LRGDPGAPTRRSRALWIAAAIAIFVLLVWWAFRAWRARQTVPAETTPATGVTARAEPPLRRGAGAIPHFHLNG